MNSRIGRKLMFLENRMKQLSGRITDYKTQLDSNFRFSAVEPRNLSYESISNYPPLKI